MSSFATSYGSASQPIHPQCTSKAARYGVQREGRLKLSFHDTLRASPWQGIYSLLDLWGRNGLTVRR
jgi:hypothetical protein